MKVFKQLTLWKGMRKKVFALLVVLLAIFSAGFAIAGSAEHVNEINKAFNCLDDRVEATSITLEEAVFAALAKTPDPKINLTITQQKSSSENCWPSSGCTVKATSQVVLAKIRLEENVTGAIDWLKSKSGVTQQMTWYLQVSIDSNEPATCKINYDDSDHSIAIGEDMKLSGTPGNCLAVTASGYWMKIASGCLDKGFSVQCDKGFKTNLLYEKETGGTIYVSSQTHGASANSWTSESIVAKCFKESGTCNYEGSLWAAAALYASGEDISEYAPYLRSLAADNEKYFPSAFLVAIYEGGDEHYAKIIDSERARPEGAYWQMPSSSYGKFYDTALAMLALGGADSPEIDNAKTLEYLFRNQDDNGCWNGGNIRDTAFIIYAAQWPRGDKAFCDNDEKCDAGENSANCLADCPYTCGDGVANGEEACDGSDLRGQTSCRLKGYDRGNLSCTNQCTYNVGACVGNVTPICGNGVIEGSELCDCGSDEACSLSELNGSSCTSVGSYAGGNLGCSPGCLTFNVSQCYTSGGIPPPRGGGSGKNCTNSSDCPSGEICKNGNCTNNQGGGSSYNPNLLTDCELAGLFCVPGRAACTEVDGVFYPETTHACNNFLEVCCTKDVPEVACASLGGTVCQWDEPCTTQTVESKDGPCCVGGTCEEGSGGCTSNSDCPAGRVCTLGECVTQTSSECNDNADCDTNEECNSGICESTGGGNNLWIWIVMLLVLIVLVVMGIVFRDKIRLWWYRMRGKAKSSKVGPTNVGPGMLMGRRPPPRFGPPAGMRPVMGGGSMMRPGMARPAPSARQESKSEKDKEAEETLRKLKEMSK